MSTFRQNSYWDATPAEPTETPFPAGVSPSSPRPGIDALRHVAGRLGELYEDYGDDGGSFDPEELRELGERLDAAILEQLQSKP